MVKLKLLQFAWMLSALNFLIQQIFFCDFSVMLLSYSGPRSPQRHSQRNHRPAYIAPIQVRLVNILKT